MIQRYEVWLDTPLVDIDNGRFVLYSDHLAVVAEKDAHIKMLVRLCLEHGIISRGLACEILGMEPYKLDEWMIEGQR